MAGETDLIGMLVANPQAFYALSLFIIFILGGFVYKITKRVSEP